MSFSIKCPNCGSRLRAEEAIVGQTLPCPKCRQELVIQTTGAIYKLEAAEGAIFKLLPAENKTVPSAGDGEAGRNAKPDLQAQGTANVAPAGVQQPNLTSRSGSPKTQATTPKSVPDKNRNKPLAIAAAAIA